MNDTLTPSDISAAEDELLRDVDTLQDWIGTQEVFGAQHELQTR